MCPCCLKALSEPNRILLYRPGSSSLCGLGLRTRLDGIGPCLLVLFVVWLLCLVEGQTWCRPWLFLQDILQMFCGSENLRFKTTIVEWYCREILADAGFSSGVYLLTPIISVLDSCFSLLHVFYLDLFQFIMYSFKTWMCHYILINIIALLWVSILLVIVLILAL